MNLFLINSTHEPVNPSLGSVKLSILEFKSIVLFLIDHLNPALMTFCKIHLRSKESKICLFGGLLMLLFKKEKKRKALFLLNYF